MKAAGTLSIAAGGLFLAGFAVILAIWDGLAMLMQDVFRSIQLRLQLTTALSSSRPGGNGEETASDQCFRHPYQRR
jgi:hypothetical protein